MWQCAQRHLLNQPKWPSRLQSVINFAVVKILIIHYSRCYVKTALSQHTYIDIYKLMVDAGAVWGRNKMVIVRGYGHLK